MRDGGGGGVLPLPDDEEVLRVNVLLFECEVDSASCNYRDDFPVDDANFLAAFSFPGNLFDDYDFEAVLHENGSEFLERFLRKPAVKLPARELDVEQPHTDHRVFVEQLVELPELKEDYLVEVN